jgi:phosphoserine phosphatase
MVLVAFDFDGTLADSEMLDRLAASHGVGDEVADITARAMAGELSYGESLRERASLVAGLPSEDAADVYESVHLRDGAGELLRRLAARDVNLVVLTGGFGRGVEAALDAADASVDDVVANRLPEADGRLTGEVEGPLIERPKDEALSAACEELGVDPGDAVAVGDGANDVPMLRAAWLAVGFRPKPTVRDHCDDVVESMTELEQVLGERGVLD